MEIFFFNTSGAMLFTRCDLEEGHWVQEEMSVTATFPFVAGKVIEHGMRLGFHDPATDNIEVFEIRNVQNIEPDHYQQIIAEHIAISELSDEHINTTEITDKTPTQVLTTALTGTLWSVGNVSASNVSSCDIARGSVWQALQTIQTNWNVYCIPRVTVGASGTTGKYIDIIPAQGTFRGVRMSISKNMHDATVTYDDTDVLTALYGYGGNVEVPQTGGQDDKTEELTFKDEVWTATGGHPAKPANQTYLEWPEKTALYGRNGRPRYGFYQNGDIKDAGILLQKTWESLQKTCDPKVEITGTVSELKRYGLADVPMRLHDEAIVEITETGVLLHKEIIKLDVDLVDPSSTVPYIGDYVPNIIYINRDTDEDAKGGGGGGGGRGQTKAEKDESDTYTMFVKTNNEIGMVVGRRSGDLYIKAGQIVLAINKSGETGEYESTAWINADHINIGAGQTVYTLAGDLYHDENGKLVIKSAGGLWVQRQDGQTTVTVGVWDRGNLTGGVMITQINGESSLKISGDRVDINGSSIVIDADRIDISGILTTDNIATVIGQIEVLYCQSIWADAINIRSSYGITAQGRGNFSGITIGGGSVAEWKSKAVGTSVSLTRTGQKTFILSDGTQLTADCVTGVTLNTTTINYIGTSDG